MTRSKHAIGVAAAALASVLFISAAAAGGAKGSVDRPLSGAKPAKRFVSSTYEYGRDRPGGDYANFPVAAKRADLCKAACLKDRRCRAWSFVFAGRQGPQARCWLKNRIRRSVRNNWVVSGVIKGR